MGSRTPQKIVPILGLSLVVSLALMIEFVTLQRKIPMPPLPRVEPFGEHLFDSMESKELAAPIYEVSVAVFHHGGGMQPLAYGFWHIDVEQGIAELNDAPVSYGSDSVEYWSDASWGVLVLLHPSEWWYKLGSIDDNMSFLSFCDNRAILITEFPATEPDEALERAISLVRPRVEANVRAIVKAATTQ